MGADSRDGWVRGSRIGGGVVYRSERSAGACLLGQVGTDMNHVVCDHAESDPAPHAVRPLVERSPQPMASFENTDAAFAACAPFLKLFEPTLFLALLAGGTLGVLARNRHPFDSICSAWDSLAAEKNPGSAATCSGARPNCSTAPLKTRTLRTEF